MVAAVRQGVPVLKQVLAAQKAAHLPLEATYFLMVAVLALVVVVRLTEQVVAVVVLVAQVAMVVVAGKAVFQEQEALVVVVELREQIVILLVEAAVLALILSVVTFPQVWLNGVVVVAVQ